MEGYSLIILQSHVQAGHDLTDQIASLFKWGFVIFVIFKIFELVHGANTDKLNEVLIQNYWSSESSFFQAFVKLGKEVFF